MIAILSSMVCDVMNVAAVGTERTVMSSSIRSRGSNDLATSLGPGAVKAWSNLAKTRLTCSSRLSQNEISSFGVLNTRGSHSRRRGSRKLKILQARLQREEGISRSGRQIEHNLTFFNFHKKTMICLDDDRLGAIEGSCERLSFSMKRVIFYLESSIKYRGSCIKS